ncbi:MAG: glycosyltransferase [Verrucomicrobium sp.]
MPAIEMPVPLSPTRVEAWQVSGRWFREATGAKVMLKGVTYGPFKPNSEGLPWPERDQVRQDFAQIASLGFNTVRVYELPSESVLHAASGADVRLLVGIPWTQHVDFLNDSAVQADALKRVREAARTLGHNPVVAGLLVGNEVEKTLVRWLRPEPVRRFLEKLIGEVKAEAPGKPVAYASYPSTEYLVPRNADFVTFNVFLEDKAKFAAYLRRLQVLADGKPLVISEFGLDTKTHTEAAQAQALQWQRELVEASGVAGNFWFSFTDEWHRGGEAVTGWDFGLVKRDRRPKLACEVLAQSAKQTETSVDAITGPKISVIVCTRNGALTLRNCLAALGRQTYANHEVLVIDDGSTDATPDICRDFPFVRYYRQAPGGLSAARNHGMREATGEILAYTDDDCIPDEDWLKFLAPAFDDPAWVAAGGPNLPPPPRNLTEACVAAAPGAPAHVLMSNEEAEHLPGCNLAIRRTALQAIEGFRDEFITAGDDVDVCWRLQERGGKLRFVPGAVVWHHRRFTIGAYLRQQRGYGHAEAMLIRRYPQRFAWLGGARWRGAIYGDEMYHGDLTEQAIHFGVQGTAPFQCIYTGNGDTLSHWLSGLPWLLGVFVAAALGLCLHWSGYVCAGVMLVLAIHVARKRAAMNEFMLGGHTWRHRELLRVLCFMQPVVRDWARLRGMIKLRALPHGKLQWPFKKRDERDQDDRHEPKALAFWSDTGTGREEWLAHFEKVVTADGRFRCQPTAPWSLWDGFVQEGKQRVWWVAVTEYHGGGRCVTRIKTSAPPMPGLWIVLVAMCLVELARYNWIAIVPALFLVVYHAGAFFAGLQVGRHVQDLAKETAANAGLTPLAQGSQDRPQSGTVPLPAAALDSH